ncbi:MAG TPA: hypothetical protein DC048_11925, partial [Planctomycetaceae bacterium]|nr:hypothetical protein [Planctomycetaceae bacterium]
MAETPDTEAGPERTSAPAVDGRAYQVDWARSTSRDEVRPDVSAAGTSRVEPAGCGGNTTGPGG